MITIVFYIKETMEVLAIIPMSLAVVSEEDKDFTVRWNQLPSVTRSKYDFAIYTDVEPVIREDGDKAYLEINKCVIRGGDLN